MQTKELVEYRKTATIRAEQYLGQHVAGVCTGGQGCQSRGAPDGAVPHIHTLEGDLTVSHGDWIATGVQGEHWAIKPDVFAASYVPVEQGLPTSSGGRGEAWRTVPVEPTEAMIEAALDRPFVRDKSMYELIYRAMIDAAPLPSSPSQGGGGELGSLPPFALPDAWRPIESAPKDRTAILAVFRADIYPALRPGREDLQQWNGVQAVLRHTGLGADGFDVGWAFAAPVGNGGFPDEWIAGWKPLDAPPTSNHAASAAANQNPENVQGEA